MTTTSTKSNNFVVDFMTGGIAAAISKTAAVSSNSNIPGLVLNS